MPAFHVWMHTPRNKLTIGKIKWSQCFSIVKHQWNMFLFVFCHECCRPLQHVVVLVRIEPYLIFSFLPSLNVCSLLAISPVLASFIPTLASERNIQVLRQDCTRKMATNMKWSRMSAFLKEDSEIPTDIAFEIVDETNNEIGTSQADLGSTQRLLQKGFLRLRPELQRKQWHSHHQRNNQRSFLGHD